MNFKKLYSETLFKKNINRKLLNQIFIDFKTNPDYFTKYHQPEPDESNRFCLYCGLKGHIVEKCQHKHEHYRCYRCKNLGHIAKHCKEEKIEFS